MRAVQFTGYGSPQVVRIAQVASPRPGPGEIRVAVRVSGLSTGDVRVRAGTMRETVPIVFPYRTGFDAAGIVDELGEGVIDVRLGDEVFGMAGSAPRGTNADHAVLGSWAPRPPGWSWQEAGGAAGSVETATRVLDRLGPVAGRSVLVHGASGATGTVVVQMARARGAVVLGTGSVGNHELLRSLGVRPTTYGPGLGERVRALVPQGVDAVVDCAGGALPELVALAGGPQHVITIADLDAASHGVHMSHSAPVADTAGGVPGADPLAAHGLADAVALAGEHQLRIPIAAAFPLERAAAAHELSESHHRPGRIVFEH